VTSLFIIEAPGKIASFKKMLDKYPVKDALVLATRGHLFTMPDSLFPLGIDEDYKETLLAPKNKEIIAEIREAAKLCDTVYVATDPDHEGEVIASDIKQLLSDMDLSIQRLRLHGINVNGLKKGFDNIEPVDARGASAGVSRRIMDRIIGATLSHPPYIYTGRVQGSIIDFLMKSNPVIGYIEGFLPSSDGGDGFRASIPITRNSADKAQRIAETLNSKTTVARVASKKLIVVPPNKNWDCAQTVSQVSKKTNMPIGDVMRYMQKLYEEGKMSYPRSDSAQLSNESSKGLKIIARNNGMNYTLPDGCDASDMEQGAHESPHPIDTDIDISLDVTTLSEEDAVMSIIARNHLLSGNKALRAFVSKPDLASIDPALRNIPWQRVEYANLPWNIEQNSTAEESLFLRKNSERIVLDAMSEAGIGRPSTYVNHVRKFLEKGMVDNNFNLTENGHVIHQWIDSTEPAFFRGGSKKMLETVFSDDISMSARDRVESVLDSLPEIKREFEKKVSEGSGQKELSFPNS